LTATALTKSIDSRVLFQDLSFILTRGQRLGLIGPNGSGKSTLLRTLIGEQAPDSGTVRPADGLQIVYFDQNRAALDKNQMLRDALSPNGETVNYRGQTLHVSGWAKRFLFAPDQLQRPLGTLSGGEQARVLIAQLMLLPADVLILDEPTNDLDIPTLQVLEDSLATFPGGLILVSHDRFLLDNVSTEILALDGRGGSGFYTDYDQWKAKLTTTGPVAASPAREKTAAPPAAGRMSAAERREYKQIETQIANAEETVRLLKQRMEDPDVVTDAAKLQEAWAALPEAEAQVMTLYARWEELEAMAG
jgi:ATP-binding cassette subfamily F protein uup